MKPQEVIRKLERVRERLLKNFPRTTPIERGFLDSVINHLKDIEKKKALNKADREAKKIMDSRYGRDK